MKRTKCRSGGVAGVPSSAMDTSPISYPRVKTMCRPGCGQHVSPWATDRHGRGHEAIGLERTGAMPGDQLSTPTPMLRPVPQFSRDPC